MHRQRSDIAAGKEQRRNHVPVGRHDQPARRHVEKRRVVALIRGSDFERCRWNRSRISSAMARPPPPWVMSTHLPDSRWLRCRPRSCRSAFSPFLRGPEPAIGPVGRARAFRRHHAGAHRIVRRADRAEQLAVGRLLHAAQDRRAFAGFVSRDCFSRDRTFLGVELGIGIADAQRAVRNGAEPAPFELSAHLEHLVRPAPAPCGCPRASRRGYIRFRPHDGPR
jgi:hypothetical protein